MEEIAFPQITGWLLLKMCTCNAHHDTVKHEENTIKHVDNKIPVLIWCASEAMIPTMYMYYMCTVSYVYSIICVQYYMCTVLYVYSITCVQYYMCTV